MIPGFRLLPASRRLLILLALAPCLAQADVPLTATARALDGSVRSITVLDAQPDALIIRPPGLDSGTTQLPLERLADVQFDPPAPLSAARAVGPGDRSLSALAVVAQRLAAAARVPGNAAALALECIETLAASGARDPARSVLEALARVPRQDVQTQVALMKAVLLAQDGEALAQQGQPRESDRAFTAAQAALDKIPEPQRDDPLFGAYAVARARIALASGQPRDAIDSVAQAVVFLRPAAPAYADCLHLIGFAYDTLAQQAARRAEQLAEDPKTKRESAAHAQQAERWRAAAASAWNSLIKLFPTHSRVPEAKRRLEKFAAPAPSAPPPPKSEDS